MEKTKDGFYFLKKEVQKMTTRIFIVVVSRLFITWLSARLNLAVWLPFKWTVVAEK